MTSCSSNFRRSSCIALFLTSAAIAQQFESVGRIEAAARTEAQARLPAPGPHQRLIVGPVDGRLRLLQCPAGLLAQAGAGTLRDRTLVEVRCAGGPGWRTFVPVRLAGTQSAVALARSVIVGQTLKPEDLTTVEADSARLPVGYFGDPAAAIGLTMNRSVAAGAFLSNQLLTIPNAIVRGQQVTLLASADGLYVRMAGRAMSDGYVNQRIKVQNNSSGKIVEGIARSDHLVEINAQ
jgi:flagellar basal body P-ring formation protein FlgA